MSGAGKEGQHGDGRALCSACHSWRGSCLTATTIYGEELCVCSRCMVERGQERNVWLMRKAMERGKARRL